jgi:hypothetical protein
MTIGIIKTSDGSLNVEAYIGIQGRITVDGLDIDVAVTDARVAYGRLDLRVKPVSGEGFRWVSAGKFVPTSETTSSVTATVLPFTTRRDKPLLFGEEVARRKANNRLRASKIHSDGELVLQNIKSHMGHFTKKEEEQ